jgi:hypothetical protein
MGEIQKRQYIKPVENLAAAGRKLLLLLALAHTGRKWQFIKPGGERDN